MHAYVGHGLRIRSTVELPPLPAASVTCKEADLTIRTAEIALGGASLPPGDAWLRGSADEVIMYHHGLVFRISRGTEVTVDAPGEESTWLVRLLLLGPVMAMLIHQRGLLPMHASAVAIDGRVCAFVGESGWGKSTIAAALSQRGHPIVADDVLGVGFDVTTSPVAYPAFPYLRIAPGTATALGLQPHLLRSVHPDLDERLLYPADQAILEDQLPLHCVYLLAVGDEHRIDRIEGTEAFAAIARHTYVNRALLEVTGTMRDYFDRCAQMAKSAAVYRLQRPRSLDALAVTARTVEEAYA